MNRPAFVASFIGAAIGTPFGLAVVALLSVFVQHRIAAKAKATKLAVPAKPEAGLRLVQDANTDGTPA